MFGCVPRKTYMPFNFQSWQNNKPISIERVMNAYIHSVHPYKGILSSPEPKARVSYCQRAPSAVRLSSSSVRPSSVRKLFTFSTSPEPLDGFWWNLVWMKYSRSLTSVVVFRPGADPGRGQNRSRGSPSSRNFFRPEGSSDKPIG